MLNNYPIHFNWLNYIFKRQIYVALILQMILTLYNLDA